MAKWLIIASVFGFLVGVIAPAAAQSNWEGQFVTPPSGGVWLIVSNQTRYIQPAGITQEEFDQFERGDVVGRFVAVSPSASAPEPKPTAVPPPPPAPAGITAGRMTIALTGQGCSRDSVFAIRVEQLETTTNLLGVPSGGLWAVLTLNVTNQGPQPGIIYLSFTLQDERGRNYEIDRELGISKSSDLAKSKGIRHYADTLQPGVPARVLAVFQVAADVSWLEIVPNRLYCH